jgi:hypothetical protein
MTSTAWQATRPQASWFTTIAAALIVTALVRIEWSYPYCLTQFDGPSYAFWGLPLPWMRFTGVSSGEYFVMTHVYAANVLITAAALRPVHTAIVLYTPPITRRVVGILVRVASALLLAIFTFFLGAGIYRPVGGGIVPMGTLASLRPVGIAAGLDLQPGYACTPSTYWFDLTSPGARPR